MAGRTIYLDHNATTPLDPQAREEMLPWLGQLVGNPSSQHGFGRVARQAVDLARQRVAGLIGAQPEEIVFTSGATEADNLAILGAVGAVPGRRPVVAASAIEHQAVLQPCRQIAAGGGAFAALPVDGNGVVEAAAALSELPEGTLLLSVMAANNETGVVQPVAALSPIAGERGLLLHTDAAQAGGRIPLDVDRLGVDLLSLSGHKLHGPQGTGALYVRRGTRLAPRLFGGHQERELRPGTESVAAIVGFGKACELAASRLEVDAARVGQLRAAFEAEVVQRIAGAEVNGAGAPRLPNTSSLRFADIVGEELAASLDAMGVAASAGAACHSGAQTPSHVLAAMGCTPLQARSAVRFSFGRGNCREEALRAAKLLAAAVARLREHGCQPRLGH